MLLVALVSLVDARSTWHLYRTVETIMATIKRSITIHAPIEQVTTYLVNATNVPLYSPGISRVEDVQQSNPIRIDDSYRAIYSVMGLEFPTKYTLAQYDPPHFFLAS